MKLKTYELKEAFLASSEQLSAVDQKNNNVLCVVRTASAGQGFKPGTLQIRSRIATQSIAALDNTNYVFLAAVWEPDLKYGSWLSSG